MRKFLLSLSLVILGAATGTFLYAQINVANPASEMSGKTVMLSDGAVAHTVSNLFTFNRSGATPFSVAAGSATVPNLLNWSIVTITTTGTQNNFAPGLVGNTVLRCNNASLLTITGFANGVDGQMLYVVAMNNEVDLAYLSGSSSASNQLQNSVTSGPTPVMAPSSGVPGGYALYVYSSSASKWILIAHDQGASIDYSGTSTITGWASFTIKVIRYRIIGKTMMTWAAISGTSNNTLTNFTMPYTTIGNNQVGPMTEATDNTAANHSACIMLASTATVSCRLGDAATTWTAAGTKTVSATGYVFEIQ